MFVITTSFDFVEPVCWDTHHWFIPSSQTWGVWVRLLHAATLMVILFQSKPVRAWPSPSSRTWHKNHHDSKSALGTRSMQVSRMRICGCGCRSTPTFIPHRLHPAAPRATSTLYRLASRNAMLFRPRQPDLGNAHRRQLCSCSKKVVVIKSVLCKRANDLSAYMTWFALS